MVKYWKTPNWRNLASRLESEYDGSGVDRAWNGLLSIGVISDVKPKKG